MNRFTLNDKVLFLDIDGVLNNLTYNLEADSYTIERNKILLLNKIIRNTENLNIVISSAWRYMILNFAMSITGFKYMLRSHGMSDRCNLHGYTISDEQIGMRENQIIKYLDDNCENPGSFIEQGRWCVVDDLPLTFKTNFVKTTGYVGLTQKNIEQILEILNG